MGNYNVVFEGAISDGYKIVDVKRNLADLFFWETRVRWTTFSTVSAFFGSDGDCINWCWVSSSN